MKRVLLVNPQWPGRVSRKGRQFNRAWPPLSLLVCASILRNQGHDVRLVDGRVEPDWQEKLERESIKADHVVLTSTPIDRWQCPNLDIDAFLKTSRSIPHEKLIVAGAHGTIHPEHMLDRSNGSAVIIGEPEEVLPALLTKDDWSLIPNVAFRKDGHVVVTHSGSPPDIAQFPMPAFDLVDPKAYHYELMGDRFMLFESARGCPFQCSFCLQVMYGKGVRLKPISRLLGEVTAAVRQFGFRAGYFIDLEFTIDRDHVFRLCNALIEEALPFVWCCQTRADAVDRELLDKMRRAGCRLIHFGVESGVPKVLERANKGMGLDRIVRGIRLTQEAGIDTACFFMLGFPGECKADMQRTISFAKSLNPTYASFHAATPYPHTPLYQESVASSGVSASPLYFPSYCSGHDEATLDSMTKEAFKQFYFRSGYVMSQLLRRDVRSWVSQLKLLWAFVR